MYRPPFAYPSEPGCRDKRFTYTFDASNTPVLNQDLNGLNVPYIQLPLEQDAPFYWRGFTAGPLRISVNAQTTSYALPNYSLMFWDCYENKLSDCPVGGPYIQAALYGFAMNPLSFRSSLLQGPPVEIEEIYCPPGGVIQAFITLPSLDSSGGKTYSLSLSLHGVKRYKECD